MKNAATAAETGMTFRMSTGRPRIFSIARTARCPPSNGGSGGRFSRPTKTFTPPNSRGRAPNRAAEGGVCGPSRCSGEHEGGEPPDPLGSEDPSHAANRPHDVVTDEVGCAGDRAEDARRVPHTGTHVHAEPRGR